MLNQCTTFNFLPTVLIDVINSYASFLFQKSNVNWTLLNIVNEKITKNSFDLRGDILAVHDRGQISVYHITQDLPLNKLACFDTESDSGDFTLCIGIHEIFVFYCNRNRHRHRHHVVVYSMNGSFKRRFQLCSSIHNGTQQELTVDANNRILIITCLFEKGWDNFERHFQVEWFSDHGCFLRQTQVNKVYNFLNVDNFEDMYFLQIVASRFETKFEIVKINESENLHILPVTTMAGSRVYKTPTGQLLLFDSMFCSITTIDESVIVSQNPRNVVLPTSSKMSITPNGNLVIFDTGRVELTFYK